ncbi:hypothetical protein PaeCFBP13512_18415 [Paenibacillus sp. CFBP13512]|uniref:hypothetical protein n=1 Tax=Paenibacillus sp. CFBP13512 TaxID=2184007 RepID=UPI0010C08A98|nr:hypothetical protein [Paenibacillus sp. CFBP13512]TKJ87197.1 hypothetical protein PaeCFBP13512_18415 [Paenibacillus sp. CFBP13512]
MAYSCYKVEVNGQYHSPDYIDTVEELWEYITQYKNLFPAIMITDTSSDEMIAEVKNGHVVYPMYLAILDVRTECLFNVDQFDPQRFQKHMKGSELKLDSIPVSIHGAMALLDHLQIQAQRQYEEDRL